ncbi:MAG TPA: ATP-binding protein [Steroidobacteraceae bacterium]|nr:ATP-binding protein [Steroidobacteraceae bacterium]
MSQHAAVWFEIVGLPGGLATTGPLGDYPVGADRVDTTGIGLRMALLDDRRRFIVGIPRITADSTYRPVVASGRTVGWVVMVPFDRATSPGDLQFQRRQLLIGWIIGLLAVLVAGLGAVALANAFLTPIHRIADATRRLTAGDFSARLPSKPGDEIDQLAADVNQLARTLQRTEQVRRSLMADISHELRTPLAILRGELEALEDGVRVSTPQTLQSLIAEVRTLSKLVDDIYDVSISDIGALNYRREELDLVPVLSTCVTAFRERFASRGLQAEFVCPVKELRVSADESRLQQLFNNLFENCVRHTARDGQVRISATTDERHAVIRVEDSGPGVAEDQIPKLFERFYRADESRNRRTGGAGLGLAICRNIVEAHNGAIDAGHSPLGGLSIEVRLPLA